MKKTISLSLLLFSIIGLQPCNATETISATNSNLNVSATTIPLSSSIVGQGFDFYEINTDGTLGNVVLSSATGLRTAPSTWTLTKNGTTDTSGQTAKINLSGTSGQSVSVAFGTSANLTGTTNTASTLTLTNIECGTDLASGVAVLGSDGTLELECGGTLSIPANAPVDKYSGDATVTISY